jgi:cardiolipin synthase
MGDGTGIVLYTHAMLYSIISAVWLILFLIAAFEILTGSKPLVHKVIWLLVVFFLPIVGVILYYLVGRGK